MIDYLKRNITLSSSLSTKLKELNIIRIKILEDINVYISNLFTSETFVNKIFGKSFEKYDWERLYFALKNLLRHGQFINNGILMEKIASYIITEITGIVQIMELHDLEFEDPDKGTDLLFIDSDYILKLFEVKSIIPNNGQNYITNALVLDRIKNALSSLFCSNLKNVSKLCYVRKTLSNNYEAQKAFDIAKEILVTGGLSLIDYTFRKEINFNICIIGKEFRIVEEAFLLELESIFFSTSRCDSNCSFYDKGNCERDVISKLNIMNIIDIEFIGDLNIREVYRGIMRNINEFVGDVSE